MKTAYKILRKGHSCHGGSHVWGLPKLKKDGTYTPGRWTPRESPKACSQGWHLTRVLGDWWGIEDDYEAYLAEYRGEVDKGHVGKSKFAVQQCRLLRPLTSKELARHGIYRDGIHNTRSCRVKVFFASGTATVVVHEGEVTAGGKAKVSLYSTSSCRASGRAVVYAYDNTMVEAIEKVTVVAADDASVIATGAAKVQADDSATVTVLQLASVIAHGSAKVTCAERSKVVAHDFVTVIADVGTPKVHVMDKALCRILNGKGTYTRDDKGIILDERNDEVKLHRTGRGLNGFIYDGTTWVK